MPEPHLEAPLIDEVRQILDDGQPLDLLGLVSMVVVATASGDDETATLDELVTAFIGTPGPETTALLAVLARMLVDNNEQRTRCLRAVAARPDVLPAWLAGLDRTTVHRAVLMTDVFGDGEELLLGVRLADGQELTCAVYIDHLMTSAIKDAFFVPDSIDAVVAIARASNNDPDTTFVDLDPADAGAVLAQALDRPLSKLPLEGSDTWPSCRALVQWLVTLLPAGGSVPEAWHRDPQQTEQVLDAFFRSLVGMAFDDAALRELLELCVQEGNGDALRWSTARLAHVLGDVPAGAELLPVEVQQRLPELLRAFVPFAHAKAGIRQELTVGALAVVDERADHYRQRVLDDADVRGDD